MRSAYPIAAWYADLDNATTESKWEVTYDSVEVLNQGKGTVLPQQQGSAEMPEDALQHLCESQHNLLTPECYSETVPLLQAPNLV